MLVHGNRLISLLVINKLNLSKYANYPDFEIDQESIFKATNEVIDKLHSYLENYYSGNMLGTLFKNVTKYRDIFENCI